MAYLREYRMMSAAGDPGFGKFLKRAFKVPKSIRKMQPGKVLGRALPVVASVIPGVGPIVSRIATPAPPVTPVFPGFTPEFLSMMDQLRALGIVGDPGFLDVLKGIGGGAMGALRKIGIGSAGSIGTRIAKATQNVPPWVRSAVLGGVASGAAGAAIGAIPGMFGGGGGSGRRYRRMNPGNTRALRRAMRRVESFSKLAHQTISFTKSTKLKKRGRKR